MACLESFLFYVQHKKDEDISHFNNALFVLSGKSGVKIVFLIFLVFGSIIKMNQMKTIFSQHKKYDLFLEIFFYYYYFFFFEK